MTIARDKLISLADTPYYHCISRCVRRAWLCGDDPLTNKNYDYRKQWFIDRLEALSAIFAIDICAYAIMSNHYHLVLQVDKTRADNWTDQEVLERWAILFKKSDAANILENAQADKYLIDYVNSQIPEYRARLSDISWFMRCLNEYIAREANKDDNCKGRFWEGRFKSQALLDEAALLACMAYVDLNPIRAGAAKTLEKSEYTSIKARMVQDKKQKQSRNKNQRKIFSDTEGQLLPFTPPIKKRDKQQMPERDIISNRQLIPYEYKDYLDLVTWTGKVIRTDKKGYLSGNSEKLLNQYGIQKDNWLDTLKHFGKRFYRVVGKVHVIDLIDYGDSGNEIGWLKGKSGARRFYGEAA